MLKPITSLLILMLLISSCADRKATIFNSDNTKEIVYKINEELIEKFDEELYKKYGMKGLAVNDGVVIFSTESDRHPEDEEITEEMISAVNNVLSENCTSLTGTSFLIYCDKINYYNYLSSSDLKNICSNNSLLNKTISKIEYSKLPKKVFNSAEIVITHRLYTGAWGGDSDRDDEYTIEPE